MRGANSGFINVKIATQFLNDARQSGGRELDDKVQVMRDAEMPR